MDLEQLPKRIQIWWPGSYERQNVYVYEKPTVSDNLMVRLDGNQDGVLTKDEFVDGCIKVIKSVFLRVDQGEEYLYLWNIYFRMLESSPLWETFSLSFELYGFTLQEFNF